MLTGIKYPSEDTTNRRLLCCGAWHVMVNPDGQAVFGLQLGVLQNDLSSVGISESSMPASRIWRKPLKPALPLVRDPEVARVILPFHQLSS